VIEASRHAFEDGLRTLRGQRHGERIVRVRPDQDQDRNGSTSFGEIDVNLAEIRLDALARIMRQRNERLAMTFAMLGHIASHGVVAALVLLVLEPLEDPHRRVTLLGRLVFIGRQDLVDRGQMIAQLAVMLPLTGIRLRLPVAVEHLANLPPRVMKLSGNLANGHPIAMSAANPCVIVHRKHPILRKPPLPLQGNSLQSSLRWVQIQRRSPPAPGPFWTPISRPNCFLK